MRTDFDFRRTVTTLTFCGSGMALTPLLAWMTYLFRQNPDLIYRAALGVEGLLLVVMTGLAMTVALRQISAKVAGASFDAEGGDGPQPSSAVVTTVKTAIEENK